MTRTRTVMGMTLLIALAFGNLASAAPSRAFLPSSYWNTPLDLSGPAPVHSNNAAWIADSLKSAHTQNYLALTMGSFALPYYSSTCTDKAYTINPAKYGDTYTVRIPAGAKPMPGTDSELAVFDMCSNQAVGLHHAVFNGTAWTSDGLDHYALNSQGLARKIATSDSTTNSGHRGIPSPIRAVRHDEVTAGAISHRLECYWHATAEVTPEVGDKEAYWPMVGAENGKGGIVPEGVVIRIKRSVNLASYTLTPAARTVAKSLQDYGCTVGDNSGSGNRLKIQANASWAGMLNVDSLKPLTWNLWEFVRGGYDPRSGTVR